jgi:ABC-type thiamin/hydroxymethylpyrimidine transport system permease subunit
MLVARAQQPIAAAAVSLVIWVACVASFLPPLNRYTTDSVPLIILAGFGIAVSVILHLIFIGVAAKRLGRSPTLWVVVALCGFPIASIVGLIMFEWFSDEQHQKPA